MARENKTRNALLGLLSIGPMSGYDMKKLTDFSLGYFWSENYGHIYPILRKLGEGSLITRHTERTRGRPDRNVYRLTGKGEKELDGWLDIPAEKQSIRNEFLLKLFFGRRLPRGSDTLMVMHSILLFNIAYACYCINVNSSMRPTKPINKRAKDRSLGFIIT